MINKSAIVLLAMLSVTGCNGSGVISPNNDYSQMEKGGGYKVDLCHVPPGNPANVHTINISVNAVGSHLNNHAGDHLGPCDCSDYSNCDTGTVDTGTTTTGTGTGTTTDTGTATGTTTTDTGVTTTGTGTGGDTGTTSEDKIWAQGGCNTVASSPASLAGIFSGMMLLLVRRKDEV
jgi:hypothetical protein